MDLDVVVKDDSGEERKLIVTRNTADSCIKAGHDIRHLDEEQYMCDNCTSETPLFWYKKTFRNTRYLVTPISAWTNHTHAMEWMDWDGSDNYYVCKICKILSNAHDFYDMQQRATRGQATQPQ